MESPYNVLISNDVLIPTGICREDIHEYGRRIDSEDYINTLTDEEIKILHDNMNNYCRNILGLRWREEMEKKLFGEIQNVKT